jgi:hypothetical protein
MHEHCRRLIKVFFVFSFVSLMLCPYAEIMTASHGGKILIQQDDFRKTKKLVLHDFQPDTPSFYFTSNAPQPVPAALKETLCVMPASHQRISLSIFSTVQLLL